MKIITAITQFYNSLPTDIILLKIFITITIISAIIIISLITIDFIISTLKDILKN